MSLNSRPVDPSVKIPAAVLANARRAEELMAQQHAAQEPVTEPVTQEAPPAEMHFEQPAPVTEPVTQEQAPPAPPADERSWEHKYLSLKGRYDKEIPQLRDELRRVSHELRLAHEEVATLRTSVQSQPARNETHFDSLITDEERKDYGDDFLNVVAKRAKEVVGAELAAAQQKIAKLEQQVGGVAATTQINAREKMFKELGERVANWKEINSNQEFLDWLALPDRFTGQIRHNQLKVAFEKNNADQVSAFFESFLQEAATVAPHHTNQPDPSSKVPLEKFAAPGRAKSAAPGRPAEKPLITRAMITRFYTDKAAGKYRGKEAEAAQFEKDLDQAMREGRVQ
jgi:hypothetical protein